MRLEGSKVRERFSVSDGTGSRGCFQSKILESSGDLNRPRRKPLPPAPPRPFGGSTAPSEAARPRAWGTDHLTSNTIFPTEAEIIRQIASVNKSIKKAAKIKDKRNRNTTRRKLRKSSWDCGPNRPVSRVFRTDAGGDGAARGNRSTGRLSSNRWARRIPTGFFFAFR